MDVKRSLGAPIASAVAIASAQCVGTSRPAFQTNLARSCDSSSCSFTALSAANPNPVLNTYWQYSVNSTTAPWLNLAPGQFSSTEAVTFNATTNVTRSVLSVDGSALLQYRFQVIFRNCNGNTTSTLWYVCSPSTGLAFPFFASPYDVGTFVVPVAEIEVIADEDEAAVVVLEFFGRLAQTSSTSTPLPLATSFNRALPPSP